MNYNRRNYSSLAYARPCSFWAPTYSVELYHHGVKGMKWGVRREQKSYNRRLKRDLSMLNAHDYQQTKKGLKAKYETGEISRAEYKSGKKEANKSYKQSEKRIKKLKAGPGSVAAFAKTRTKAMSEIPHYKLKRGIRTANSLINIVAGVSLAATAGAVGVGAAMMGAGFAATYGASVGAAAAGGFAVGGAAGLGVQAGVQGVDRAIRRKILKEVG